MMRSAIRRRFIPHTARQPMSRHDLGLRRIYVLPNRMGLAFGSALLAMLIASVNYNLSLGYALTFLLLSLGFVALFHGHANLSGLSIRPGRAAPVFCGEPALFPIHFDNPATKRRPALHLKAATGSGVSFDLPAQPHTVVELPSLTSRRGIHTPGRTVLETVWPLGIVRAWSVFVPNAQCLVYPAPERRPPALPQPDSGRGSGFSADEEGDEDFAGLRTHRLGDPPRRIAWKALARSDAVLTKQFSTEEGSDILLDWHALPRGMNEEARLSRLAAWVLEAERRGFSYALTLPGVHLPPDRGDAHKHACLRRLALFGLTQAES